MLLGLSGFHPSTHFLSLHLLSGGAYPSCLWDEGGPRPIQSSKLASCLCFLDLPGQIRNHVDTERTPHSLKVGAKKIPSLPVCNATATGCWVGRQLHSETNNLSQLPEALLPCEREGRNATKPFRVSLVLHPWNRRRVKLGQSAEQVRERHVTTGRRTKRLFVPSSRLV